MTFYSLPADMITQILNFGLPAPIDIQIDGAERRRQPHRRRPDSRPGAQVPGIVDARIQQPFDYPNFDIDVDRTKAQQSGLTERDVANSVLDTLSGSFQTTPMFFLNPKNGVNYHLAAQTPQYDIQSLQDLRNIPVTRLAQARRRSSPMSRRSRAHRRWRRCDHYNIRRVIDIYATVQGRDLGAVGRDIERIVDGQPRPPAARQLRDRPRPARDHARRPTSAWSPGSASRSCSSIC